MNFLKDNISKTYPGLIVGFLWILNEKKLRAQDLHGFPNVDLLKYYVSVKNGENRLCRISILM